MKWLSQDVDSIGFNTLFVCVSWDFCGDDENHGFWGDVPFLLSQGMNVLGLCYM